MHDLPESEAQALLQASRYGVLALGDGEATYALPMFYAFDGQDVYLHCHPGQKDDLIRRTGEACLVVVHMESEHVWESVQAFGPLEVLTLSDDLEAAKSALFQVPFPPAGGNFPGGLPRRTEQQVYYVRLAPSRIVGKASTFTKKS